MLRTAHTPGVCGGFPLQLAFSLSFCLVDPLVHSLPCSCPFCPILPLWKLPTAPRCKKLRRLFSQHCKMPLRQNSTPSPPEARPLCRTQTPQPSPPFVLSFRSPLPRTPSTPLSRLSAPLLKTAQWPRPLSVRVSPRSSRNHRPTFIFPSFSWTQSFPLDTHPSNNSRQKSPALLRPAQPLSCPPTLRRLTHSLVLKPRHPTSFSCPQRQKAFPHTHSAG
jgi:hypothetical protein